MRILQQTAAVALSCLVTAAPALAQQDYPARSISMLLGVSAGGGADLLARLVAQKLGEQLGVQVLVVNRPGANANIAAEAVAKAPPDGYTLLFQTSAIAISPALYVKMSYDVSRDLAPVALTGVTPLVFVVHPSLPVTNISQFIGYAKKTSGKLTYSSNGSGNVNHLAAVTLMQATGFDAVHVPYKGAAPAVAALAGGEVQFSMQTPAAISGFTRDQRIRSLAVTSLKRVPTLPDVPTMHETILPNFEFGTWQGVMAPGKTAQAIIAKLNGALVKAIRDPDLQAKFAAADTLPVGNTPQEYRAYLQSEIARLGKAVKSAGLTPE
jgi:tripartite-type tricarboxylate transporter receptor subunit TctC